MSKISSEYTCSDCSRNFANYYTLKKHFESAICIRKKNISWGGARRKTRKLRVNNEMINPKQCNVCKRIFKERRNMLAHRQRYHNNFPPLFPCGLCTRSFTNSVDLLEHRERDHQQQRGFYVKSHALKKSCQVFRHDIPRRIVTVNDAIQYMDEKLQRFLKIKREELKAFKFAISLGAEYLKDNEEAEDDRMIMNFRSSTKTMLKFDDISELLSKPLAVVEANAESFNANGSNWVQDRILYLDIEIGRCFQLSGSCSLHLLCDYQRSDTVLEVVKTNEWPATEPDMFNDGRCFFYAVASYFLKGNNKPDDLEKFLEENVHQNISWPVNIKDIDKFEEANQHLDMCINVIYKDSDNDIYPVYISKRNRARCKINLLLFHVASEASRVKERTENVEESDDEDWEDCLDEDKEPLNVYNINAQKEMLEQGVTLNDPCIRHYALVEDMDKIIVKARLLQTELQCVELKKKKKKLLKDISANDTRINELKKEVNTLDKNIKELADVLRQPGRYGRIHVCYNCFSIYSTPKSLQNHESWCFKSDPGMILIPHSTEKVEFELKRKNSLSPIQMFFDFEAIQVVPQYPCSCRPKAHLPGEKTSQSRCAHGTKIQTEQKPFAYCIVVCDSEGYVHDVVDYLGEDAGERFLSDLLDLENKYIHYIMANHKPMKLSSEEEENFQSSTHCHICEELITLEDRKVRDHCHQTGKYIGAAHNICNLNRRDMVPTIPVFSHNFIGYDSHFLIATLPLHMKRIRSLSAIPLNTEKFKQISINNLVLKDSMAFMDGSLEKLVETLMKSNHQFNLLKQVISTERKRNLLLRKGVYPYEFITSIKKLLKQTDLPPRKEFYSHLTGQTVSQKDYEHARTVWKEFDCRDMTDYTRLYVLSDTVLLAEVIQRFRKSIFDSYNLDPVHYISLPGLAKDIMLKGSGCRLDLIKDIDMIYFFKNNIRGGLSYISTRHADIDEMERKTGLKYTILYVDANSLYGCAMSHKLPSGDYTWMTQEQIKSLDIRNLSFESDTGYAFEVTLKYPEDLHLAHNSYPLAAEHINVSYEELSPYAKNCLKQLNFKYASTKKLGSTFKKRVRYVCHGLNLKLYLELGLELEEIHSGVMFSQGDYMKQFVDDCAERRRNAVSEIDSMIAKRIVNSVFGKVIKN